MSEKNRKIAYCHEKNHIIFPYVPFCAQLRLIYVQLCELGMTSEIPGHVDLANTNVEELGSAFKCYFKCTHLRRWATYCNKFLPCLQYPLLTLCHYCMSLLRQTKNVSPSAKTPGLDSVSSLNGDHPMRWCRHSEFLAPNLALSECRLKENMWDQLHGSHLEIILPNFKQKYWFLHKKACGSQNEEKTTTWK